MATDADIRTALTAVLTTAAPLAVVYPWWCLGADQDKWPGILRSTLDLDANGAKRTHGYVLTRKDSTGEDVAMRGTRRTSRYTIAALHYYTTGTTAANSDLTFHAEIDAITAALDDKTTLDALLQRRKPITWALDLKTLGGELVHIGMGSVEIELTDCN